MDVTGPASRGRGPSVRHKKRTCRQRQPGPAGSQRDIEKGGERSNGLARYGLGSPARAEARRIARAAVTHRDHGQQWWRGRGRRCCRATDTQNTSLRADRLPM